MPYSFNPIINDNSEILILGTMPSIISLQEQQYYANPKNHFWYIIYSVFDEEFDSDYKNRYKLLLDNKIALWDVLSFANREGSLDSAIKNEIPNDIQKLLHDYPKIRSILLNGSAAEKYFKKYFKDLYVAKKCIRVSSTSPIPGKNVKTLHEKKIEWKEALSKL